MAKVKQTWPITAFDAVGIRANQGKFVIQGIDGDEVILEGDFAAGLSPEFKLRPGRPVAETVLNLAARRLTVYTAAAEI